MSESVDKLTEVAEAVRAEEQPQPTPEPVWNLSQILKAMRESRDGSVDGDEMLVSMMCVLLEIPKFDLPSRQAVAAQVLG